MRHKDKKPKKLTIEDLRRIFCCYDYAEYRQRQIEISQGKKK